MEDMHNDRRSKRRVFALTRTVCLLGVLALLGPISAAHAEPPQITSVGVRGVTASGATLLGAINPKGISTTYRFEYLTVAAYEANIAASRDPFTGATFAPAGGGVVGSGSVPTNLTPQELRNLVANTGYRYRLRAANANQEVTYSEPHPFGTEPATNVFELLDHRGWEMVSPIGKGGGAIQPPGTVSRGGVFQASAPGGSFTFSSADSFGAGAQGAPSGSQYVATEGSSGWVTANITTPLLSGSYGSDPDGVPYQLFSGDLGFGLLSNGERCRGVAGGECPVANPPLPGSGAPAGFRDYYRRTSSGSYESLLTAGELLHSSLGPEQFELRLVAATPDVAHIVLSSCAALTADATEVAAPGGCDPAAQNLYEWSSGTLSLINLVPGAQIAAPRGAISNDGTRVYFKSGDTIYLREGSVTKTVLGGPGVKFAAASATNGSTAYLIDAGQLVGYTAATQAVTPLTNGTGVEGVLGLSANGAKVYYAEDGGVFLRSGATVDEVASSALPSNLLANEGTARVTEDGSYLLFLSEAELTGYPSEGETEVFLYGPSAGGTNAFLTCVSCNPSGEGPLGSARIPGTRPNGGEVSATDVYEPRNLSANGKRVFFETTDHLASLDTNKGIVDVYEWEADGEGTCGRGGGCVQLISGGQDPAASYFLDANEDGSEAFFLTSASLYPLDPGSYDVYVARVGGGFSVPEPPVPCVADACQILPEAPEDPTPGTLAPNSGNPPLTIAGNGGNSKGKKGHHPKHKKSKKKKGGSR